MKTSLPVVLVFLNVYHLHKFAMTIRTALMEVMNSVVRHTSYSLFLQEAKDKIKRNDHVIKQFMIP